MHKKLIIRKSAFEGIRDDMEYLQVILDKYNTLWEAEPENFMENFNENQITLLFYGILYNQVHNGGFLQLIFNGYAPYIFCEPLIDGLKEWGAVSTAKLIKSISDKCLQVADKMDKTSLENLSKSYTQYPEFKNYDNDFYKNNGLKEVKKYVSLHINDFITVE